MNTIHPTHQAGRTGRKPPQLAQLLARRERLATAASEYSGHDLPGADLLWQEIQDLEDLLRKGFPTVWKRRNADWVEADAARQHSADQPQPQHCRICAQHVELTASLPVAS